MKRVGEKEVKRVGDIKCNQVDAFYFVKARVANKNEKYIAQKDACQNQKSISEVKHW